MSSVAHDKEAIRLRDELEAAVEKRNRAGAAEALRKLAAIEATEPRWPHRLGETLMRLGRASEAERAFAHAATMYASQGFLARAIAVAKLAVEINPSRTDLLASLDPQPAQSLRHGARAIDPAKLGAPSPDMTTLARPLEPKSGASDDEVLFEDAPESCAIEIEIDDVVSLRGEPDADVAIVIDEVDPIVIGDDLDADRLSRLSGATLFADVPRDALHELAQQAQRAVFVDRQSIFTKGEPASALLVIVEGRVDVCVGARPAIELGEGEVLGETTILTDAVRTADVRARGGVVALRVDKAALDRIIVSHPRVEEVLFGLLARRLVSDAFERSSLFAPFDAATRREIARSFEVRRARSGTPLQQKGKRGDGLYLVLSGAVETHDGETAHRLPLDALIGRDTLLSRTPAARTVTVARDSVLLRLPATKFAEFVTGYPPALEYLAQLATDA